MFRKAGLLCAALAMFSIAGGPWAMLQGVAWMQMLGDYSQRSGSVAVGLAQTFDGQHPCHLCQEIQSAKAKEHQRNGPKARAAKQDTGTKALPVNPDPGLPGSTPTRILLAQAANFSGSSRTDPPPTPPPRRGGLAA